MGKLKRAAVFSVNSRETLSSTLRTLGSYVDRENRALLRIANYELLGAEIVYRVEFAFPDESRLENILSKQALDEMNGFLCQGRK